MINYTDKFEIRLVDHPFKKVGELKLKVKVKFNTLCTIEEHCSKYPLSINPYKSNYSYHKYSPTKSGPNYENSSNSRTNLEYFHKRSPNSYSGEASKKYENEIGYKDRKRNLLYSEGKRSRNTTKGNKRNMKLNLTQVYNSKPKQTYAFQNSTYENHLNNLHNLTNRNVNSNKEIDEIYRGENDDSSKLFGSHTERIKGLNKYYQNKQNTNEAKTENRDLDLIERYKEKESQQDICTIQNDYKPSQIQVSLIKIKAILDDIKYSKNVYIQAKIPIVNKKENNIKTVITGTKCLNFEGNVANINSISIHDIEITPENIDFLKQSNFIFELVEHKNTQRILLASSKIPFSHIFTAQPHFTMLETVKNSFGFSYEAA